MNNQKTVKHGKKLKAPDSKPDRFKRRKEVYRLYFELGYSGVEIADFMKKDKKTIYADIDHIYNELGKEHQELNLDNWLIKQLTRLEKQRGQLMRLLEKQSDFDKILSTQKLILDVDSKISSITIKTKEVMDDHTKTMFKVFNQAVEEYNKAELKKSKYSDRPANTFSQGYKVGKFKMIFE